MIDQQLRILQELISEPKKIHSESRSAPLKSFIETKNLPESLDWRTRGVIAPVRNEGLVGEIVTAMVSTGKFRPKVRYEVHYYTTIRQN